MTFTVILIQIGKTSCARTAGFYGGIILWGKAELALVIYYMLILRSLLMNEK